MTPLPSPQQAGQFDHLTPSNRGGGGQGGYEVSDGDGAIESCGVLDTASNQVVASPDARQDARRAKDQHGYVVQRNHAIISLHASGGPIYAVPMAMEDSTEASA